MYTRKKERRGFGKTTYKQKEVAATRKSLRTASEICFSKEDEDRLLDLVAQLDGVVLQNQTEQALKRAVVSSDESSTEDDGSDSSSDSDTPISAALPKAGPLIMTHQAYRRKLVRDDRYQRKAFRESSSQSSEVVAARIRSSIKNMTITSVTGDRIHPITSSQTIAVPAPPRPIIDDVQFREPERALKKSLRLNISCAGLKGKATASKLVVVDRDTPLKDIIKQLRGKFNVGAKYNALVQSSKQKVVDEFDLMDLPDGEALQLSALLKEDLVSSTKDRHLVEEKEDNTPLPPAPIAKGPSTTSDTHEPSPPRNDIDYSHHDHDHDHTFMVTPIEPNPALSKRLREKWTTCRSSATYQPVQAQRNNLPIFSSREELLETIRLNQVTVVCGETGSGKSTQLPLYLLEQMVSQDRGAECSIICTQPRRIAAISLAERVAYEYGDERLGDGEVGYQIRLDSRMSANTRLLYCTTGILLQKLQSPSFLANVSHVILDEVHERGVETDFLMTLLKQHLSEHSALRVVCGYLICCDWRVLLMVG